MGIDKTYSKIRFSYFWYNMYRDVVEHIQKCEPCVMRKSHKKATPMQDMPIPNYPFEIVGIDTCGPYSLTSGENRYLVTIIDHFSGWPEAFHVKDKSALSIAECSVGNSSLDTPALGSYCLIRVRTTMLQRLHIAYTHVKENTLEAREHAGTQKMI